MLLSSACRSATLTHARAAACGGLLLPSQHEQHLLLEVLPLWRSRCGYRQQAQEYSVQQQQQQQKHSGPLTLQHASNMPHDRMAGATLQPPASRLQLLPSAPWTWPGSTLDRHTEGNTPPPVPAAAKACMQAPVLHGASAEGRWTGHRSSPLLLRTAQSCRLYSGSSSRQSSSQYVLDYAHSMQYPGTPSTAAVPATAMPGPHAPQSSAAAGAAAAVAACGEAPVTRAPAAAPPGYAPRGQVVAVAVSGGVDSAVSAMLLQQQGYQVFAVYMHNWDPADEAGAGTPTCTSAADLADAKALCKALGIPLYEADFVSRYWNEVFETFLQGLSHGLTPNPDLACNSHIKFGALLQFAREKGADLLATGHYARLGWIAAAGRCGQLPLLHQTARSGMHNSMWQPVLLTGSDPDKDQTYFLAGLTHQQLEQTVFPVGHLTKAHVRDLAAAAGLTQATKRSSAGICFIGRRSFGKFLEAYLQPQPGVYVDADSGDTLGPCSNMLAVTVGQKALGLGGQKTRVYVVGKDMAQGLVYVAAGHDHPALYSRRILLQGPSWVAGHPPAELRVRGEAVGAALSDVGDADGASAGVLHCQYQARYRQKAEGCSVRLLRPSDAAGFGISRFCRGLDAGERHAGASRNKAAAAGSSAVATLAEGMCQDQHDLLLVADLHVPLRGIAPGQMFVMYDGEVCLGSATIVAYGPTLHEQQ